MKKRALMKGVTLGLCIVLTAATLIGCGNSASKEKEDSKKVGTQTGNKQEEVVTLQMWKAASDENRNAWWENIIAEFEKTHPNIKIEYLGVPGDASAFTQKLDLSLATGDAPDIISTFLDTSMIERGIVEPLDKYWDSWENKDQVPQQYIDIYKSMDYKSETPKLYATPNGANVQSMYVRPDLLKNVGLEVPTTWDEFFEAAEKTTDKDQGISGYIIRGGGGNASALEFLMYSYSGITDFFIDGKCTINDPLNVEFVEKYLGNYGKYTSEDDVNKSWPEMAAQFQAGKATMMFHNLGSAVANYEAFENDTDKILATPFLKSVTGKILIPSFKAGGNIITSSSKHKEEAWIFLEWMLEAEQDTRYHELMSTIPINTESQKADWIQNVSYMKMGSDMYTNPDVEFCTFPYYLPNFSNIENNYASPNIQRVMLGEMTAQELLDGWAAELQADYDTVMK
jgi:multiple sugar transport system substrate-binding protein